eukprot:2982162-Pleurochrysis_carterae.AAC.2
MKLGIPLEAAELDLEEVAKVHADITLIFCMAAETLMTLTLIFISRFGQHSLVDANTNVCDGLAA